MVISYYCASIASHVSFIKRKTTSSMLCSEPAPPAESCVKEWEINLLQWDIKKRIIYQINTINNVEKIHSLLPLLHGRRTNFQAAIAPNSAALLEEYFWVKFLDSSPRCCSYRIGRCWKQCHWFSCFPPAIKLTLNIIFLIFQEKPL